MSKEVEEELLFPSSEVHFSTYRSIIGVCPQDVDRDSAYNGKILWPVILTGAGIILVEDDVERPMQLIFYGPMRPEHFEHALGGQTFGQGHIMHPLGDLAITSLALFYDAANGGEVGEVRCLGRPRDDVGAPPFVAIVSKLAFLMEGEFAALISDREGGLHALEQRGVIGFELQGVMRSGLAYLGGHGGMTMQGVGGDDAAFQNQTFQHRERCRDFIAARRMPGRQRHPRLGVPHTHHQRRHAGVASFIAAPQALAVDCNHALGRTKSEPLAQCSDKAGQSPRRLFRIEKAEHTAKAVMARRAMREVGDFRKQFHVGSGKICDSNTRLRSAQSRCQRNEQYCRKVMPRIEVSRVTDFTENRKEALHADSPESGKPPSESSFPS